MAPPPRSTAIQPIQFKDFTPGISDNPGVNYPAETATRANTFRCIANRGGALVPLPARTEPFHMPHVAATSTTPVAIVGLYVPPIQLLPATGAFNAADFPEHELMVGVEWMDGTNHQHNLYRVRRFADPGTGFDTVISRSFTDTSGNPLKPSGMGFGTTRSNRADHTHVGAPVVVAGWGAGPTAAYLLSYPDDQNLTSGTPYMMFDTGTIFLLNFCCHQGRTVLENATAYGQGANASTFMGENLQWSKVNNVGDWTANADPAVAIHAFPQAFVEENPSGFAVMVSMSANELFCVKSGGGGLYVSGDLDNPTVVSLPMVTGADMSAHVVSEIGVVYGNRTSGVWVWPHGDTSQLLSPKMDPRFWVLSTSDFDDFGGLAYQMARCDEWILTPNNWLFDTQLKSWWRLDDPADIQIRYVAARWHYIYGSESYYTATSDGTRPAVHEWKRTIKASTFSWQSQPIWQSVAEIVNVNEIELVAQGQGTVTLTLTALDGETRSISLALANCGYPERFREAFAIQGKYLQLRVNADSGSGLVGSPTVYSVTLYPFTEQPIGRSL